MLDRGLICWVVVVEAVLSFICVRVGFIYLCCWEGENEKRKSRILSFLFHLFLGRRILFHVVESCYFYSVQFGCYCYYYYYYCCSFWVDWNWSCFVVGRSWISCYHWGCCCCCCYCCCYYCSFQPSSSPWLFEQWWKELRMARLWNQSQSEMKERTYVFQDNLMDDSSRTNTGFGFNKF